MKKLLLVLLLITSPVLAANVEVTPTSTDSGVTLSNTTPNPPGGYGSNSLVGAGITNGVCDPTASNVVGKLSENWCSSADGWLINSSDPSAIISIGFTGTPNTGRLYTLNFHYNSTTVSVSYTSGNAGDTVDFPTIIQKLVDQVRLNSTLYNVGTGGYHVSGKLVGSSNYVPTNTMGIDYKSSIALKMSYSITGGVSDNVAIVFPAGFNAGGAISGGSTQSVQYDVPSSLDNNPFIGFLRTPGAAPAPGSQVAAIYAIGVDSSCPTSTAGCVNYGTIINWVGNSTHGSLNSAWLVQGIDVNGGPAGGLWIGNGVFSNYFGSPFTSSALTDPGAGLFNAGIGYRIGALNSAPTVFDTLELDTGTSPSTLRLVNNGTGHKIAITSLNGISLTGSQVSISSSQTFDTLALSSTSTTGASGMVITNNNGTTDFFLYAFNSAHVIANGEYGGMGTSKNNPFNIYTNNAAHFAISAAGGIVVGGNVKTLSPAIGEIMTDQATYLIRNATTFTNNSGANTGTLTNAPSAGNPTKWIRIDDNGVARFIPAW